jgi:hypothetical protein
LTKLQLDHVFGFLERGERLKAIKDIPKDLISAYGKVIERIETGHRKTAFKVLAFVYRACRPLRMDEMLEALVAAELPEADEDFQDTLRYTLPPSKVIECCKSLVDYDEAIGSIRFAHTTVQEFITTHLQHELPTDEDLAMACLRYLAHGDFQEPCVDTQLMEARIEKFKFGMYAAQYWGHHTRGVGERSLAIHDLILQAFRNPLRMEAIVQMKSYAIPKHEGKFWKDLSLQIPKGPTLLHILASESLPTLCALELEGGLSRENRR